MKSRRIVSIILCLTLLASCVFAVNFTANAKTTEVASTGTYQDMLAQTAAGDYGLADTVNQGTIIQAWNWSYNNILANLETIADQGFTTIQVSPPNEIKMPTKGVNVIESDNSNGWWMFYQPAGFQLNESKDNALGTKAEFVKMCEEAHKLGLKIIVDAVINHMGTDDDHVGLYDNESTNPMDHVNPRAKTFEPEIINAKAFHSPWKDCRYVENMGQNLPKYVNDKPVWGYREDGSKYHVYDPNTHATVDDITESLTRHCTSGLPDLDTSTKVVQTAIYDYMKELIESGADGFRIDAAKHIETSKDVAKYRSDFWENTLLKIRQDFPDNEVFAYGEILNKCGDGRPFSMYTSMMDVTDSSSYWGIKDAATKNGNGNAVPFYPNANFTKQNVMLWDESHDTYIDGSTTSLTTEQRNRIWALVAGRAEITSVYLARPDDATKTDPCKSIKIGDLRKTSWANPTTKAINKFHNFFSNTTEEYCNQQGNRAWIERGDSGCMIVNLNGAGGSVSLASHILKNGNYIDSISGNKFVVNGGRISGNVSAGGIATIYFDNGDVPEIPTQEHPTGGEDVPGVPTMPGCNTIVFSNNKNWSPVNIYFWNKAANAGPNEWAGVSMKYYQINDFGEKQFIYFVPQEYDGVIINDGTNQTEDITVTGHMGIYIGDAIDTTHFKAGFFELQIQQQQTEKSTEEQTEKPTERETVVQTEATEPTVEVPTSNKEAYVVGDADGDSDVTISDATIIQRHLAKLTQISSAKALAAADVDNNKSIEILDATIIQRHLARIPVEGSNCGKEQYLGS